MKRLVDEPDFARQLGARGLEHCRKFTWTRFVAELDDYLDTLPARQLERAD